MNTLLVDSAFLFKKSFLGGKNIFSNEKSIGALFTFFTTLRKLYLKYPINKNILMWDGENSGKARYLIYKEYKANRESKSWYNKITLTDKQIYKEDNAVESELWQRIRIKQYAEELFFRQLEVDEIEGDDLIAHYCLNKKETENVIIYTNDRDYSQLLSIPNVSIKFDNIDELITSDNFEFLFNYDYRNALTIKILTGDNSDNINGVAGLGEDTLIKYFPELINKKVMVNDIIQKSILINEERVKNKKNRLKVLDKIVESKQIFIRNKKIMDLSHPFINTQVKEEYKQLYYSLDPSDRGSKNLMKLMHEDGFLNHFYKYNFLDFVKPFYSSITEEIKLHEKNNGVKRKKNINSII
jgi:5'-3' exonuclease